MLETAFALKRLPECTSRHTGTLDTCRLGSAWAGRDEPSRLRAGPHVRGARCGLTVAQVGLRLGAFRSVIPRVGWLGTVLARAYSTPVDSFRESNPLAAKGVLVQGAFSLSSVSGNTKDSVILSNQIKRNYANLVF